MITKDKVTEIFCIADDFCKDIALSFNKQMSEEKALLIIR